MCLERYPHKPIVDELPNTTLYIGETLQLNCHVFSDPTYFVEWSRSFKVNGSYIDDNGNPYSEIIAVRFC